MKEFGAILYTILYVLVYVFGGYRICVGVICINICTEFALV